MHDRVASWQEELIRLDPILPTLPAAARRAVHALIAAFVAEDAAYTDSRGEADRREANRRQPARAA